MICEDKIFSFKSFIFSPTCCDKHLKGVGIDAKVRRRLCSECRFLKYGKKRAVQISKEVQR